MAEISYEQALEALRSQLGSTWEGGQAEGRAELARVLQRELGCSAGQARDAIEAMVSSGQLRYEAGRPNSDADPSVLPGSTSMLPSGTQGTLANTPVRSDVALTGHWR